MFRLILGAPLAVASVVWSVLLIGLQKLQKRNLGGYRGSQKKDSGFM